MSWVITGGPGSGDSRMYGLAGTPTLDQRFASTKSLVDNISGQTLITFTRPSAATYFDANGAMQTASSDVARFQHDPSTGICLGLLIEELRTNLLLNSASLTTQTVTTAATPYTFSFYGTGTVVLSGTHSATVVGTGAFPTRTTLTFTPTAGSLTLTVTGTIQYANLEAGSFATSWIPTTGSTAQRQPDSVLISGGNFLQFFAQNTGTIFVQGQPIIGAVLQPSFVGVQPANSALFRTVARRSSAGARNTSNSDSIDVTGPEWISGERKIAATWVPNDCVLVDSGTVIGTDISTANPLTVVDRMVFGLNFNNAAGVILSRVCYWDRRLPNATLQAITV